MAFTMSLLSITTQKIHQNCNVMELNDGQSVYKKNHLEITSEDFGGSKIWTKVDYLLFS